MESATRHALVYQRLCEIQDAQAEHYKRPKYDGAHVADLRNSAIDYYEDGDLGLAERFCELAEAALDDGGLGFRFTRPRIRHATSRKIWSPTHDR